MTFSDLSQTVVVFDLDDTLYSEADYVRSGIQFLGRHIESLLGVDLGPQVSAALAGSEKDWLARLCASAALPSAAKESLLWMYRLHSPTIRLTPECSRMLDELEARAKCVAVLTDGRALTQRLKLQSLGLARLPAYVSEDYQSEKPDALRFRVIEKDHPADRYVYIGDNPRKDFIACNALGWTSIGVRAPSTIHSQDLTGLPPSALPNHWINEWQELLDLLC